MKKIFLIFILIFSVLSIISAQKKIKVMEGSEYPIEPLHISVCDTFNTGYVRMYAVFEMKTIEDSYTFIYTDSTTCTIPGIHYLPKDKITYVFIYDGDRTTAEFTWEGEEQVYKILR